MPLHVTPAAQEALSQYPVPAGKGFRIEMELTGGWCTVWELHLALDEPRPNDTEIKVDEFLFYMDKFTYHFLGEEKLTLDYNPVQGFLIANDQGIISQGITING